MKRENVCGGMMGDFLNRVFDGSARDLMLSLLETSDVDADELKEIRRMIDRKAKEAK